MRLADVVARLPGSEITGEPGLEIASVTHDSRRAGPGALFVAIRGLATDGNDFVDAARKKGAVAVVSENAPRGAGTWVRVEGRPRGARALLGRRARRPGPLARARRRDGHERQDDDDLPDRLGAAGGRRDRRPPRHGRVPDRPAHRRGGADDAGVVRPAGALPRDGRRRLPPRGARGLLALVRTRARPRPRVQGRGLHQPDARPPRLPRRHGRVLRGQAACCSRRCCAPTATRS